jgi:hypothetical protein
VITGAQAANRRSRQVIAAPDTLIGARKPQEIDSSRGESR